MADPGAAVALVGLFDPLATLPGWMRAIVYGLPPSYVFEAMRGVVAGHAASGGALALSGALALVELALAARVFAATHRRALTRAAKVS